MKIENTNWKKYQEQEMAHTRNEQYDTDNRDYIYICHKVFAIKLQVMSCVNACVCIENDCKSCLWAKICATS